MAIAAPGKARVMTDVTGEFNRGRRQMAILQRLVPESNEFLLASDDGKRFARCSIYNGELDRVGPDVDCCDFQGVVFFALGRSATVTMLAEDVAFSSCPKSARPFSSLGVPLSITRATPLRNVAAT